MHPEVIWAGYTCVAWAFLWIMCAVFWAKTNDLLDMEDPKTDYLRQIASDWTQVPFVDISVTSDWVCPNKETVP